METVAVDATTVAPTTVRTAEAGSPAAPRLTHEPALDGLRGVAVLAVVVFHMNRLQGGFLGVDLFFVLSGFLITSLLLAEARQRDGIGLRAFWARRARRLLPALWLLLVGVAGLMLVYTPEAQRYLFRDDALATLGYVANWERLGASSSYWDIFSHQSPLDHMWSLAIEEQFYLVWPLVTVLLLVLGGSREGHARRVGRVALGGAVISLIWLAVSYSATDTNWAYYSTPTRLGPTLLGAALAAAAIGRPRRKSAPESVWDVAAGTALAVMAILVFAVDGIDATYYRGGLAVFALAACVVIRAVTGGPPGKAAGLLSLTPLCWLGAISYGVYLWHWPVIVYLTPQRTGLDRWAVDVLRFGLTLLLATVSYLLVEQPIRRGALRGRRLYAASGAALAVTLGAALVATSGEPEAVAAPDTEVAGGSLTDADLDGIDNDLVAVPRAADIPDGAVKVLMVGDSGAGAVGPVFADVAPDLDTDPPVAAAFETQVQCSIVWADGLSRNLEGDITERGGCDEFRRDSWRNLLDQFEPDVVVYYIANVGFQDDHRLDGEWERECGAAYDSYLEEALLTEAELLTEGGAEMVFLTSPYTGTGREGMKAEVDCRNATIRRAAAAVPGAQVADLNVFVADTGKATGIDMFKDPVHLSLEGSRLASEWLLRQIATGHLE